MIPATIEDVLNEKHYISPCADNAELEAWLAILPAALQRVCGAAVSKKEARELAEHEFEVTNARAYIKLDDGINVTTKKMMAKADEVVIAADKDRISTSIAYEVAEVLVKAIEAKSQSVRKIATMRANTQQFSETDYVVKKSQNRPAYQQSPQHQQYQPSPQQPQQPAQQSQQPFQQPSNFGAPANSPFQQQPGGNSNYYPPASGA